MRGNTWRGVKPPALGIITPLGLKPDAGRASLPSSPEGVAALAAGAHSQHTLVDGVHRHSKTHHGAGFKGQGEGERRPRHKVFPQPHQHNVHPAGF